MRALALAAGVAGMLIAGSAQATLMQWYALDYVSPINGHQAELLFGVPRSDETLLSARCTAAEPQRIDVRLFIDSGPNQPDEEAGLTITSGSETLERRAALDTSWAGGSFVGTRLDSDDAVWEMLARGVSATVALDGGYPSDFHLTGSAAAISQFLQSCESFAQSDL